MKRFYFCIRYLPERVNCEFLAGKCIRILHAFQSRFELRCIGISFPEWSDSSIGKTVAFVSESERFLTMLRAQNYFTRMVEEEYFVRSDVLLVPSELNVPEVIFYRERRLEKETTAAKLREFKRLQRRALNRKVEYKPQQKITVQTDIQLVHQIPCGSSSGHTFNLIIGRLFVPSACCSTFSSYGLGNRSDVSGTVPAIL